MVVIEKTEEQLKEETRARRARQELKNRPLPLNRLVKLSSFLFYRNCIGGHTGKSKQTTHATIFICQSILMSPDILVWSILYFIVYIIVLCSR